LVDYWEIRMVVQMAVRTAEPTVADWVAAMAAWSAECSVAWSVECSAGQWDRRLVAKSGVSKAGYSAV